jgi:hypothetical protein
MKKYFLMAVAATAMLFASCSNDDTPVVAEKDVLVTIKLGGVKTRAVEAPAIQGELEMRNGWIYVIAPNGDVTYSEQLNVGTVNAGNTSGEQTLGQLISADSRIYIIGNVPGLAPFPTGVNPIVATTLAGIKLAANYPQANYALAALANSTGEPVAINLTGNRIPQGDPNAGAEIANVTVPVKPLFSRVELAEIAGGGNIIGYDVTGVMVDDTYPQFRWGGGHAGAIRSQGMKTDFEVTGAPHDLGTWNAVEVTLTPDNKWVAAPDNNEVWAYNVASAFTHPFNPLEGYLFPRFLIQVENVQTKPGYEKPAPKYYLTVRYYKDETDTVINNFHFERGKIYQVGGPKGSYGFTFDEEDLQIYPNLDTVELTVEVEVIDWVPVIIIPGL